MEIRKGYINIEKPSINPYKLFKKTEIRVKSLLRHTIEAVENGKNPELTSEGTSGVYMIENNENQKIAIFKPFDEEVNAPNNPRGRVGQLGSDGICKGILSGECATREVAAYLLDSKVGCYHGVPTTTYIEFYHPNFTNNKEPIL